MLFRSMSRMVLKRISNGVIGYEIQQVSNSTSTTANSSANIKSAIGFDHPWFQRSFGLKLLNFRPIFSSTAALHLSQDKFKCICQLGLDG